MRHVLTLNAGSSSIKFALFAADDEPVETLKGQVEGLGSAPHLTAFADGKQVCNKRLDVAEISDHEAAIRAVLAFLEERHSRIEITAVGHRIVHGGPDYAEPARIDAAVIAELERFVPLAPLHQPHNISGVRAAALAFPHALQVACFDTAFHRGHPFTEDTYALPRHYFDEGLRRYGFHGLSYEFVVSALHRLVPDVASGRIVVCHLGNGASMCAVHEGRSIATTMGFSPLDGLPMGTRCGQIDPGVLLYLMSEKGMDVQEVEDLLYRQSGLKGLSGLSHDMRDLEQAGTEEAEQAVAFFVSRVCRELGGLAAALRGLDALVFCGGIGEHAVNIRARICDRLEWLGIELNEIHNQASETVISSGTSEIPVLIVRTDEELMIARHTLSVLEATA